MISDALIGQGTEHRDSLGMCPSSLKEGRRQVPPEKGAQ